MKHLYHIHILILIGVILLISMLIFIDIEAEKFSLSQKTTFGVSFTPSYAEDLGLNPKQVYNSILTELNVKNLRLSAFWDQLERAKDQFDFADLDYYVNKASENNAKVILTIGYKLPRWPECRAPQWLSQEELRRRELVMLAKTLEHYENNPTITAFQLENEPLLKFGVCPSPDRQFLGKEVAFVKSQTHKPIIITDSGELRPWVTPMRLSDIFGTTLYRVVDTPLLGSFQYPFRPWFYRIKSDLVRQFFAPKNQKTIISELQAEPWATQTLTNLPIETQINRFSLKVFENSVDFARRTGFSEGYLWGTEWWYYMNQNDHPEYLNFAKTLF